MLGQLHNPLPPFFAFDALAALEIDDFEGVFLCWLVLAPDSIDTPIGPLAFSLLNDIVMEH